MVNTRVGERIVNSLVCIVLFVVLALFFSQFGCAGASQSPSPQTADTWQASIPPDEGGTRATYRVQAAEARRIAVSVLKSGWTLPLGVDDTEPGPIVAAIEGPGTERRETILGASEVSVELWGVYVWISPQHNGTTEVLVAVTRTKGSGNLYKLEAEFHAAFAAALVDKTAKNYYPRQPDSRRHHALANCHRAGTFDDPSSNFPLPKPSRCRRPRHPRQSQTTPPLGCSKAHPRQSTADYREEIGSSTQGRYQKHWPTHKRRTCCFH